MSKGKEYFDQIDLALRQFRLWEKWEKIQEEPEDEYTFMLHMPMGMKEMISEEAGRRGLAMGSLVKFIMYEWLKEQQVKRKREKNHAD